MRLLELLEELGTIGTVGTTTMPASPTSSTSGLTGNVQAINDPKVQAANLAKQKIDAQAQKKAIQDQITLLMKQINDLRTQQSQIKS